MADKPTIPDFPNLPDFGQMITQACEVVASVRGIPYDFNGTLSLENKFVVLFKTVKEMFVAQDELVKSYKALYEFINNYFSNLDVQEEVNKKIQSMADDGSLLSLFSPTIANKTSEWLSKNITNPSNPPIDKSLTVENAAGDSKETGNNVFSSLTIANRKPFTTSLPYNLIDLTNLTFGVNLYTALEQNIYAVYSAPRTAITSVIPVKSTNIHLYDKRGENFNELFEYDYKGTLLKHTDGLSTYTLLANTSYIRVTIKDVNNVNDVITNCVSVCYDNYSADFENSAESLQIANCYIRSYKPTSLNVLNGYITNNIFYTSDIYMSARVPVSPRTKIKVTCFLKGASLLPVAEFIDYNGNVIGTTAKTTKDTVYCCEEVVIPDGCCSVNVNSYMDNNTVLQVSTNYQSISEKIGYTGDSICYGLGYSGGYSGIVDKQLGITSNNIAASGGHIAKDRSDVFVISDSIKLLDSDITMLIMEGGINDYNNYVKLGRITDDYNADIDQTTFYGGLEKLMRDANTRFPEIPKAFVIIHKANLCCVKNPDDIHENNVTFENYIDAIYACCRKYGIDVIDINKNSGFNTYIPDIARKYTYKDSNYPYGDGLHPNIAGYSKWYVPQIVNWIEHRQGTSNSILFS